MPIAILTKEIKPARLNLIEALRKEVDLELYFEGQAILKEFEKTVRTWKHKPNFEIVTEVGRGEVSVLVGTDDPIYGYVDEGTRPHRIVPKSTNRRGLLFFRSGYRAKTRPRVIGSGMGGAFGTLVAARAVQHPGTEARRFVETIQNRRKRKFRDRMLKAMKLISLKAQHARGPLYGVW